MVAIMTTSWRRTGTLPSGGFPGGPASTGSPQAERDRTRREDALARLEAELQRIKVARERDRKKANATTREKAEPRTARPSARCVITRPWVAGCVSHRPARWHQTARRSRLNSGWTASTSLRLPTRI